MLFLFKSQSLTQLQEILFESLFSTHIVSIGKKHSSRLAKLCDYFEAHIFTVPEGKESFQNRINDIHSEIIERDTVLAHSKIQIRKLLRKLASSEEKGRSILEAYIEEGKNTVRNLNDDQTILDYDTSGWLDSDGESRAV